MKTLRVMSIIGIVAAGLTWICCAYLNNPVDYEGGLGWGIIGATYLLAFSIVVLVKVSKESKKEEVKQD